MSPEPSLAALQARMRDALLGGETADLLASLTPGRFGAEAAFAAHARNVTAGLVEVLAAAFPATSRAAGAENFRFAAARFARAHPPAEPRLLAYGAGFPAWLADFAPARGQPWLAELARLEWARAEALFAADATPLRAEDLAGLAPEAVPALRLRLHPSLRLVRSRYPLHALWRGEESAEVLLAGRGGEDVLVLRPAWLVTQLPLVPGDAALVAALGDGATLAEAAEAALAEAPGFDLQAALFGHLVRGSFAALASDT